MSCVTVNNSHHFHGDPDRKQRLKVHLDDFISREKALLSDGNSEMELQYRLDNFMHRLQARMEAFGEAAQDRDADLDDSPPVGDEWSQASVVEELLPASELLYLEESFGEAGAAEVVRSIEEEFGVYRIRELNVKEVESQSSNAYRLRQGLIATTLASLLLWSVWPADRLEPKLEDQQAVVVPVVETVVKKVATAPPVTEKPAAERGVAVTVMSYVGNVRDRPSAKGEVLFTLKKGDVVRKLDTKWGWYQIRLDDGREGWAYEALFMLPEVQQPIAGEANSAVE